MAEENITETQRQLSAAMLQVQNDLAMFGRVTQQSAEALKDAEMKSKFGVENFTKATNTAGQALGALAGAGIESTKAMYEGKKGMGAFNSGLDELSKAAALAGTALTLLIPGGIIMKAVIGGLTMAATAAIAYTKAANDMSDKLYKGYSGLQKSGAAAADGMTGVYRDAKKLGLSMNELDSFVGLVAANSQDLALFSGTVYDGRKKFADMGKALEGSREEFFKLGLSQTEVNEGMMNYLKTVTRTGRAQTMTTDQLAASSRNYIYEQDALAKITGMSVKQQQAALDKALQNEQFLSKIRQLEAAGDYKKADELKKLNAYYASMGEEAAEGFQATVNGNLRNKAAQKLNFASQGEVLRSTQEVIDGTKSAAQAFDATAGRVAETEKTIGRTQAAFGTTADSNLKYTEQVNFSIAAQGEKRAELEKKVNAEIEKQKQGQDAITGAQGSMIKKQQDINKKLEDDVFKGIPNAQANMAKLATATDTLADGFTRLTTALNKVLSFFGLGVKEPPKPKEMTKAEAEASKATEAKRDTAKPLQERVDTLAKQLDADEKALKDAKRAGKFGDELKPLEDKILKNKEEYEKASQALVEAEKKIKLAAQEESKLRLKQMQDRKKLSALERSNLEDAEKIKDLNEEKANLVKQTSEIDKQITTLTAEKNELAKQGKSTTAIDRRIASLTKDRQEQVKDVAAIDKKVEARKANIEGRSAEVSQLQSDLKTSTAPAAKSASGGSNPTSASTLKDAGLKIKKGDVQKEGAELSPKIIELAKNIQDNIEGFAYFSGFNDNFHNEKASSSKHTKGLAADFALEKAPSPKQGAEVVSWLKDQGASLAIDEYNNPSSKATAGHIHVEIPTFAEGGDLAAGKLGIAGEAGPEFVQGPASITPMGDITGVFNNMAMMIGQQTSAIEELIRIAKNGNDIQTKLLRVQQ